MAARRRNASTGRGGTPAAQDVAVEKSPGPSLAAGFVACLPLFVAYETALALDPDLLRNGAEACLSIPLDLAARGSPWPRVALLLAATIPAIVALRRARASPFQVLARTWAQGLLAGLVLGPLLVLLTGFLRAPAGEVLRFDIPAARPTAPPGLVPLLRLMGGAGWEELAFRVGLLGLLYLLVFRATLFLGVRESLARLAAEGLGLSGSALAFAAFHVGSVPGKLGLPSEPFVLEVFLWRVLAGIALGGIFRWKGLGVAAWAHALLNVGLALGAGTGIFGTSGSTILVPPR